MKLLRTALASAPLFALAGLALSASFGGGCAKASDTTSVDADQGCNEQAAAICKKLSDCDGFALQAAYGDQLTCAGQQKQACLALLQADGTSRNPNQAGDCATALRAQTCDDYVAGVPIPACAIQPGSLAGGKACIDSAQCASAYCRVTSTSVGACGLCSTNPPAKEGETCNGATPCDVGLACSGGAAPTCVGIGASGSECGPSSPCAGGSTCVFSAGDGGSSVGKCVPLGTQGSSCNVTSAPCDSSQGFACDPASKTCLPVTLAPSDQDCDNNVTLCAAGTCRASPEAGPEAGADEPRICIPTSIVGSSCDVVAGPDCMPPALCTGHTCTIKQASTCH
ncbi:MAG: hypothetical protein ABI461_16980 [Polyangiaceae bacterium]